MAVEKDFPRRKKKRKYGTLDAKTEFLSIKLVYERNMFLQPGFNTW